MKPFTSFFHNPLLRDIATASGYFTPVSITDKEGELMTTGLRSGNFVPRTIFYFDIKNKISTLGEETLKDLLAKINSLCSKDVFVEIRNLNTSAIQTDVFRQFGFQWKDWYNFHVSVSQEEELINQLLPGKKRQIKRSIENAVVCTEAESLEEVMDFYDILKKVYRTRVRKPLPDRNFFKAFYEKAQGVGHGKVLVVKHGNKVIAGMLCPIDSGREMYEWYVAGLDREYKGKGIYPSVMITWGAIKYASDHGIPVFNFMGAGEPSKPYGVRDFKMQFGGELINSGRFIRINKPRLYKLGEMYFKLREIV